MIRPILLDGHPMLRKVQPPVNFLEIPGAYIQGLIRDLWDTMKDAGGIGLAAPQVGLPLRMLVMENKEGEDKSRRFARRIVINPVVGEVSKATQENCEGCLSVPDKVGEVTRPLGLKISYLNEKGERMLDSMSGLEAACLLHEVDHLNGVLFTDKAVNIRNRKPT